MTEPTPEMIEAAARVLYRSIGRPEPWDEVYGWVRSSLCTDARDALRAAYVAAPGTSVADRVLALCDEAESEGSLLHPRWVREALFAAPDPRPDQDGQREDGLRENAAYNLGWRDALNGADHDPPHPRAPARDAAEGEQ